jgi:hypothetical protein
LHAVRKEDIDKWHHKRTENRRIPATTVDTETDTVPALGRAVKVPRLGRKSWVEPT